MLEKIKKFRITDLDDSLLIKLFVYMGAVFIYMVLNALIVLAINYYYLDIDQWLVSIFGFEIKELKPEISFFVLHLPSFALAISITFGVDMTLRLISNNKWSNNDGQ